LRACSNPRRVTSVINSWLQVAFLSLYPATSFSTQGGKSMSFDELLPALRELNRADKFRAMQFLVVELAKEEGAFLNADSDYPVWSPYNAFDAADTLLDALKLENKHA
jgi:hypothetical protein